MSVLRKCVPGRARLVGVRDEEHAVVGGGDLKRVRLVQQVLGALDRQAPPHLRAGRRAPRPACRIGGERRGQAAAAAPGQPSRQQPLGQDGVFHERGAGQARFPTLLSGATTWAEPQHSTPCFHKHDRAPAYAQSAGDAAGAGKQHGTAHLNNAARDRVLPRSTTVNRAVRSQSCTQLSSSEQRAPA